MDKCILSKELNKFVDELIERYPVLNDSREDIVQAYLTLEESYLHGGKLLVAGNGGSSADANHIVGELMKGFCLPRKMSEDFFLCPISSID